MFFSRRFLIGFSIFFFLCSGLLLAQDVNVQVFPNQDDWLFSIAEPVTFTVTVTVNGQALQEGNVDWVIRPEKMDAFSSGTSALVNGRTTLSSHGLDRPGFLRCMASAFHGMATAGYEPFRILPSTPLPDDFVEYWQNEIAAMDNLPLEANLEKDDEQSDEKVDVYHVNFQNVRLLYSGFSRMYGMLVVPKGEGPFPALLQVPGAGIRPYRGTKSWGEQGVIHLQIGIHGIPVNMPNEMYDGLHRGALANYPHFNLDDRENYYYRRVFLGCVRAIDFIYSLDQFDGKTLGIHGGSQGGALSVITAGLDTRIQFLAAAYPAMCDHFGYLNNRAGGWPHLFGKPDTRTPEKLHTAPYFDVVNFARQLKIPVLFGLGFNDTVCPPTSMFAAYNAIESEKEMKIYPPKGHEHIQGFSEYTADWLLAHLKK